MMLPKIKMTTWIDKADLNWVRVEAEVIDTISFGYFLFRLAKGAHLHMEQVRINNEVWLPRSVRIGGSARVALVKKLNLEQENTFKNFRKFQSDAQLAAVSAAR